MKFYSPIEINFNELDDFEKRSAKVRFRVLYFVFECRCLTQLDRLKETFTGLLKLIENYQNLLKTEYGQNHILVFGNYLIGDSYCRLKQYEDALQYFQLSLAFKFRSTIFLTIYSMLGISTAVLVRV